MLKQRDCLLYIRHAYTFLMAFRPITALPKHRWPLHMYVSQNRWLPLLYDFSNQKDVLRS